MQKITTRTTLKLSTHMTDAEILEAIAQVTGKSLNDVPLFEFSKILEEMKTTAFKLERITGALKAKLVSAGAKEDKFEELEDVGRFLIATNDSLKLIVPDALPEYPDFLLASDNFVIGLEHTRLLSNELKATYKTVKYCLKEAEAMLAPELSHLSKTVNIFIDYQKNIFGDSNFTNRRFTKEQKADIVKMIADFVRSELTGGNIKRPDFIYKIKITRNQDLRVDIELAETYSTKSDISDQILAVIANKEKKANNYRTIENVDSICLLIVVDDINSFCGFSLEQTKLPEIKQSNFDVILLFEKQQQKIFFLYMTKGFIKKKQ
jgi:hypothetical protein